MIDLKILQIIYDSEINFEISTFWDGGFTVDLGDEMNGYIDHAQADSIVQAIEELIKMVLKHYPNSDAGKYLKENMK